MMITERFYLRMPKNYLIFKLKRTVICALFVIRMDMNL